MGTNEDSAILERYLERLREREKKEQEEVKSNPDYWKQMEMQRSNQKDVNLTAKEIQVLCNYYSNIYTGLKIEKKRPNNTLATEMNKLSLD